MPFLIVPEAPAIHKTIPLDQESDVPESRIGWCELAEVAKFVSRQPGQLFFEFMNFDTRKRNIKGRENEANHLFYYLAPTCGGDMNGMPYMLCAMNTAEWWNVYHDCTCSGERQEFGVQSFVDNPKHKMYVPAGWAFAVIAEVRRIQKLLAKD